MSKPLFVYPFKNNEYRVIDGDTVEATLDLGWKNYHITSLRLDGLNAPESRTRRILEKEAGLLIKDVVIKWLVDRSDKTFYGTSDQRPKFFGRTIGRIWADDIDDCLNNYLLDLKIVRPYEGGTREPFADEELNTIIEICKATLVTEEAGPSEQTPPQ